MILSKDFDTAIVIPQHASEREQFAASELQKYLKIILDKEYSIYTDDLTVSTDIIAIGGPERNQLTQNYISEADFDRIVPGPEGIYIHAFEHCLVLAGSSKNTNEYERGTIYAVYEFLERFLGCSLAAYIKKGVDGGEMVSKQSGINLQGIHYCKPYADVKERCAIAQYSAHGEKGDFALNIAFLDWLCKNRFNYIYTWNTVYEHFKENGMLNEVLKRGMLFKVGHHDSIDTLLPQKGNEYFKEHYFETHPEYYKLTENGKRFEMVDHWGQMVLCSRNEEMIQQLAQNLTDWFSQNPQVIVYSLLNKDGTAPQCCCEECKKFSKIENYVYVINEVAKRVAKVHPHVKVELAAYTDLWNPPTEAVLSPNVAVMEATWHITGLRTIGKPDGTCLSGTFFEDNLLAWKALGASVFYYDYFMGCYPGRQRYIPMADEMQAICSRFVEKGINGLGTQIEVYNLWNNIFNFYTYGRTAYDISLSMDENLALFCRIFGKGGKFIAENIRYAESVLDGQCEIMTAGVYLMKHIDKASMYDGFEKALDAAENATARNNVRMIRMAFRYSDLECREKYENDESGYKQLKHYDIEERGELLYMQKHFDSYVSHAGYGIMIPVEGQDNGFEPDKWYFFD